MESFSVEILTILAQIEQYADLPVIVVQWYMIWRLWEILEEQSRQQYRMIQHLLAIRNGHTPQNADTLPARKRLPQSSGGIDRDPYE